MTLTQTRTRGAPSAPLPVRAMLRLEQASALDAWLGSAGKLADLVAGSPTRQRVLTGRWLGHSLHPALTDVPVGLWLSTNVLDLAGGARSRPAARLLLGLGLLSVGPVVATGWAEWRQAARPQQRVGLVHAALNTVAVVLNILSWAERRRGRFGRGTALCLAATSVSGSAAFLGGHMVAARDVSSHHPDFDRGVNAMATAAEGNPLPNGIQHDGDRAPRGDDVAAMVRQQHARIVALVDAVQDSGGPEREQRFAALLSVLARHEAAEELAIHPVAAAGQGDGTPVISQIITAEEGMTQQIGRLELFDVDTFEFTVQFQLFEEALSSHAAAEEGHELPLLESLMSADQAATALSLLRAAEHDSEPASTGTSFATQVQQARERYRALAHHQ